MQRFDIFAEQVNSNDSPAEVVVNGSSDSNRVLPVASVSPVPSSTSQKRSVEADSGSDIPDDAAPPNKKRKSELIDADAAYAARLQAEENSRARPTRAVRKAAPVKKKKTTTKSKTSKKVKASDDSDVEGSTSETKKEVNRTGGFHVSSVVVYFYFQVLIHTETAQFITRSVGSFGWRGCCKSRFALSFALELPLTCFDSSLVHKP